MNGSMMKSLLRKMTEYHDGGKGNQEDINEAEKEGEEGLIETPIEGVPTLYKL